MTAPLDPSGKLSRWRPLLPWLWALLPVIVGFCLCQVLYVVATDRDFWTIMARWMPYPAWPFYGDLTITLQHLGDAQRGLDPLSDPTSEFAYPRAVLALRHLHLQDIPAPLMGTLQAAIWMAAVIYVLRPRSAGRAILTTLIFFAPPIMFGLEEGNIDLALFVLCLAAAVLWARSDNLRRMCWPVALSMLAAFLKLYPAFLLIGGAWTDTARRRLLWILAMVIAGSYWAAIPEEFGLVMSKFHLGYGRSWGCLVVFNKQQLNDLPHLWLIAGAVYTLGFLTASITGHCLAADFKDSHNDRKEWAYYWFGAAICCGSFLTTNYAYRWVYTILTLPLLLRVACATRFRPALWARITLAVMAISLGSSLNLNVKGTPFMIVQMANWAYVLLLAGGFAALRPHFLDKGSGEDQVKAGG